MEGQRAQVPGGSPSPSSLQGWAWRKQELTDPLRCPLLLPLGRGTRLVLPGARLGALAPASLVPLREQLCLTDSSHPHTPGSCWWAKALTGVLGRPQDSHLPLCSGGPVLGHIPHPQPTPQARNQQRKLPPWDKAFEDFPNCADTSEPHVPPCPAPPLVLPLGPATGDPTSRLWVTETILGVPSSPTPGRSAEAGASRGHGPGTGDGQGWKGRVDMSHLWKGVQRTS